MNDAPKITGDWLTNPVTQAVCAMLNDAGYQAHFVGGCVRNALLGAVVSDMDISTDARPDRVVELARAAGLKAIPTGIDHGTITVVSGQIPHEITTYRKDVETDGRRAVVAFADTMEEDAHRRDFTMNALYCDASGQVVDPLGQGLADLAARHLRFIDDPDMRIREDYLRSLRFFRFHAWYGDQDAGPDPEALAAIAANLAGIETLSKERVGAELVKLLAAPEPQQAVATMRQSGVLAMVLGGADDRALAPLVHLEQQAGIAPDGLRRLAALGGERDGHGVARGLRLSNAQGKQLALYRDHIGTTEGSGALGYHHGAALAKDILLLRAAMLEMPMTHGSFAAAERGATATFPVKAADLMDRFQGKALGDALRRLERHWIDAEFRPSRSQLLAEI
ncbi:CCA tRNA nucleotidyltransferase [Thalassobius sp. MITS945101]|uniref:CCA tRNA nucleotidyltransferase n=1 Tax=Thalassobius sp. MITS945101 TaxID=3096994 RepID=UPI00399B0AF6